MSQSTRYLHLNLFLNGAGHHEAAWRHPSVNPHRLLSLDYYTEIAHLAEAAKLDALFVKDRLGNRALDPAALVGHFESFTLLAALGVRTKKIGLIASASSIYNQPYHVARKLASLDYLSEGRAAWNIQPSHGEDEAHNYGLDETPSREVRDERTREFVSVVKDLWDSWEDAAVVRGGEFKLHTDPSKVRPIDHVGPHFQVAGPLNIPRPVQGHPVLAQKYSGAPLDFGALQNAELFFTHAHQLDEALAFAVRLRRDLESVGRDPDETRGFTSLGFTLGETPLAAQQKQAELDALLTSAPGSDGAKRRQAPFVGTPHQLADHLEQWFVAGAVQGFNLRPSLLPADLELFADAVVPELQRRGLFRADYSGATLRENLNLPRPENGFALRAIERGIAAAKPLEFV